MTRRESEYHVDCIVVSILHCHATHGSCLNVRNLHLSSVSSAPRSQRFHNSLEQTFAQPHRASLPTTRSTSICLGKPHRPSHTIPARVPPFSMSAALLTGCPWARLQCIARHCQSQGWPTRYTPRLRRSKWAAQLDSCRLAIRDLSIFVTAAGVVGFPIHSQIAGDGGVTPHREDANTRGHRTLALPAAE